MAYLDIIPLADAKIYLRIDDTLTEDDAQITRMIKASLSLLERMTNHIFFARNKEYLFNDCKVNVYDYPINSVVTPNDTTSVEKSTYTNYTTTSSDNLKLTLNVGYTDVADVPQELIEVAYEIIDLMYYSSDTGKKIGTDLSELSKMTIDNYRRFFI